MKNHQNIRGVFFLTLLLLAAGCNKQQTFSQQGIRLVEDELTELTAVCADGYAVKVEPDKHRLWVYRSAAHPLTLRDIMPFPEKPLHTGDSIYRPDNICNKCGWYLFIENRDRLWHPGPIPEMLFLFERVNGGKNGSRVETVAWTDPSVPKEILKFRPSEKQAQ